MVKKRSLSYKDIESSLETLKEHTVAASDVGFAVLQAFGKSEADIRRYRDGKGVCPLMTTCSSNDFSVIRWRP